VRLTAWLPHRVVRYLAGRHLLRESEQEYETDYHSFFRTGESKAREVGRPIVIRGSSRDLGVVLSHGFLAAPRELAGLAEYLGRQGLWVFVPRLKGHGTSPEDLGRCVGGDWRESFDAGYAALSMICNRVIVGGFSFGGGLAMDCAARLGNVAGVFAVCPPMQLQDISSRFAPTVVAWNRLMEFLNFREGMREYVEIVPEHPEINYHRLPVAALVEMAAFMKELETKLPAVSAPALVIQAKGDPVVAAAGSQRLFERLGSKQKSYRLFELNNHGILQGEGAERVYAVIGEFIRSLREASPR
jgi:esterase/lipase